MAHRSIPPSDARPAPWSPPSGDRLRDPRVLGLAVAAVVALVAAWWLLRPAPAPVESSLPLASSSPSGSAASAEGGDGEAGSADAAPLGAGADAVGATSTTTAPPLVVQAAGAVRSPGLYRLDPGSRVDDLIRAAGGLTARADRERINLAAPLADGQRVWLPILGRDEAPPVATGANPTPSGGSGSPSTPDASADAGADAAPIDLNAADEEQLDSLPGVGPATAQAILTHRQEAGPFRTVDDLLDVPGIGEAKLDQLRPLVTVG